MYRVVIADDEPWALYRIQHLVEQAGLGFEIVGTANDGLSALELVKKEHPALLLSDIRMPGLDGLSLVKQVREVSPETLAIMITGFSDFSYAVDALRQGVFDYLVKPIRKENLAEVLLRAKRRIAESGSPRAYDLFFTLFSGDKTISLRQAYDLLNLHETHPCGLLVTLSLAQPSDAPLLRVQEGEHPAVLFRTGRTKMTLLLQAAHELLPPEQLAAAALPKGTQYVGISTIAPMDASFTALLRQSESAMLTAAARQSSIPCLFSTSPSPLPAALQAHFNLAVTQQDQESMLNVLAQLRESAGDMQFSELLTLVNAITLQLTEHRYGDYEALEFRHFHQMGTDHPVDALLSPIEHAIRQHDAHQPVAPSQFQRILHCIDETYMQDIKLADLSKRFFLSANYLSILIKKETGMTFSELVIRKRLATARELLVQTDTPIQDVMEQVGYRDYSSFIKLFQKHVGCTPYAYRKNAQEKSTPAD